MAPSSSVQILRPILLSFLQLVLTGCNPFSGSLEGSKLPADHHPGISDSFFLPTVSNLSLSVNKNVATSGTLTATAPGVGGTLSFSIVSTALKGSISLNSSSGAFTYTPNNNEVGADSFTFKATANNRDSGIATVSITINDPGGSDTTPPADASALTLSTPATSPNTDTTPTISASVTAEAGQIVKLYKASTTSDCTAGNLVGQNSGNGATILVTSSALTDATYVFRVKTEDTVGNSSTCSTANVTYVLDTSAPTVSTVAVQTGLTVDVTFSEAMGTGVTTAANYTVSGSGKGSLAAQPTSVALSSGNTYTLTWGAGNMLNGGDITITVANAQDSAGNAIGSPSSGTHTGGAIGVSITVAALYATNGAAWNDYVNVTTTSSDIYHATEAACAGTETSLSSCINGGLYKKVNYVGNSSCTGVTIADNLAAFDWICRDTSSTPAEANVVFYSTGLKTGKGLRDLINFSTPAFLTNYVTINDNGSTISSAAATWWANPFSALASNGAGASVVLTTAGYTAKTIFTVENSQTTNGYTLGSDNFSLVTKSGATLTWGNSVTNVAACGNLCIVSASARKFIWIEADTNGAGSATAAYGLYLATVNFSNIRSFSATSNSLYGIYMSASKYNYFSSLSSTGNSRSGVYILSASKGNSFGAVTATGNGNAGHAGLMLLGDSDDTSFGNLTLTGNTGYGLYVEPGAGITASGLVFSGTINASSNGVDGIFLCNQGSISSPVFSGAITASSNTGSGIAFRNCLASSTMNAVTANSNGVQGLNFSSSGHTFNGAVIANSNTQNGIAGNATGTHTFNGTVTTNNNVSNGISLNGPNYQFASTVTASGNTLTGISMGSSNTGTTFSGAVTTNSNGTNGFYSLACSISVTPSLTANQNGTNGVSIACTGTLTFGTMVVNGNASNGFLQSGGSSSTINATSITANNNRGTAGINLAGTIGSVVTTKVGSIYASGNHGYGLYTQYSTANSIIGSITANGNGTRGVYLNGALANSIFGPITANNNGTQGVYVNSGGAAAGGATFLGMLAANNGSEGVYLTGQYMTFSNIAAAHNGSYGLRLVSASYNKFTGNLLLGNNTTAQCNVSAGTNPGLVTTTCANNGSSDATLVSTSLNVASSVVGQIAGVSDTPSGLGDNSNTSGGAAGSGISTAAYATTLDYTNFDNVFRFFGKHSTNAFPNSDQRGACTAGTCHIWDFTLSQSDAVLLNRSGNGVNINNGASMGSNGSPVLGQNTFTNTSACPPQVNGSQYLTSAQFTYDAAIPGIAAAKSVSTGVACASGNTDCYFTYLQNAMESSGNGNTLCETGETCQYLPNFGAYQGHGTLGTCIFNANSGPVTGVSMQGYDYNGR